MADKINTEILQRAFESIRDERAKGANTARRIGDAFLSLLAYASQDNGAYLSREHDDAAMGLITFLKGLVSEGVAHLNQGAQFGGFVSGMATGKGAAIDGDGNAEVESIKVRSYMQVLELIVNRLSAFEGDQFFTESDTIEQVDDLGSGCYGLHLRSKYQGYFTAQHVNNVIKGMVNNLATATTSSTSASYYTSWMRINSVNAVQNYIEVTLYPDTEVPGGQNFPPCELMNIARFGNQTDETLQSCFYVSSTEGASSSSQVSPSPYWMITTTAWSSAQSPSGYSPSTFHSSRAETTYMPLASSHKTSYR